ncbi:MAG: HD domain-containing protein, partial [Bacteroidetes bacterium]|nr:HD domain-containing protein [Bacteroidota bacterium]
MYSLEEKILLLGALFHDIGKFEQRCRNYKGKSHSSLGAEFVETLKPEFIKIFENDSSAFSRFKDIILHHHNRDNADFLVTLCTLSDHISASERVILEQKEEPSETWQHKFLSSIFSKINLLKDFKVNNKYYQHRTLDKSDYNILLPKFESTSDAAFSNAHYKSGTWEDFEKDTQTVLGFYDNNDDFNSVVNLLLMVFEKYMWCIPDFTGSQHTDISLYNHLKDVTALSHALYISKRDSKKPDTTKLNLIIGDLPGIQSYIFNVINKKLAKILRGRSIFVQVITSVFANIFLDSFGLTESNLIMLAGGKFYIIAPDSQSFIEKYSAAVHKIEKILVKNYDYEFKFAAGCYTFDAIHLRDKKDSSIPSAQRKKMDSFGDIIEKASFNLLKGRNQIFKKHLFAKLDEKNFILDKVYKKESDSDKVKCAVTAIPLTENNKRVIKMYEKDDEIEVSKQVKIEFEIGSQITHQTVVIPILISPDGYFNILEPKG